MKSIVAKVSVILSIIFIVISICGISSMNCLKGMFPMQKAIINSEDIMYGLNYGDIRSLPYNKIPFFYVALILVVLSSVIKYTKTSKVKSIINIVISIVPAIFVLITHDYIWFMILMNIYLILYLLIDFTTKSKVHIAVNVVVIIIGILNLIQVVKHLNLEFDPSNITGFKESLIVISQNTLKVFALWLIPYGILLIKEIITTYKTSKTIN